MKSLVVMACAIALTGTAFAADHGPVFSYATPVNSEREISFDTGIIGQKRFSGNSVLYGFWIRLWRHPTHYIQCLPPGDV